MTRAALAAHSTTGRHLPARRRWVLVALSCMVWLGTTSVLVAHAGQPRLEVSPERVRPGASLTVRGVGFADEDTVVLNLIGAGGKVAVSTVTTDAEGGFTAVVLLPTRVAAGTHRVTGSSSDHEVRSPALTVAGPPVSTGQGEERRDEDEPLLAPLPVPEGAAPLGVAAEVADTSANTEVTVAVIAVAVVLLGGAAAVGMTRRRKADRG